MTDLRQPLIVFIPFAAALLALLIGRWTGKRTGWLMAATALASFVMSLTLLISPPEANTDLRYEWIPGLSVRLAFLHDGFGAFFACLVSGVGTLVAIYSSFYVGGLPAPRLGRYYAALIGFMAAMLGVALSDDLILLFVFWEITSITSFLLIGFWYEQDKAKKGALTALQVTGLGGLVMMAGFLIVGNVAGTYSISELLPHAAPLAGQTQNAYETLRNSPLFEAALLLILVGAFTKSAQWPFHFWLPNAMVAPTPVSTYLHSATMVKAGVFLVGRMLPIFGEAPIWSPVLIFFGLFTFLLGAYQALMETDLKAILARTTVSALGLFMFIYGLKLPEQDALQILNHAAYKGTLFLVAGMVEHAMNTRDIRELGGLRKYMPITFGIALVACLSMAGLPPFLGFAAKESLYDALLHNAFIQSLGDLQWVIIGACVLANALTFAAACKLLIGVFLGSPRGATADAVRALAHHGSHSHGAHVSLTHDGHAHDEAHHDTAHLAEPQRGLWIPAAVLGSLAAVLGLLAVTHLTEHMVSALSSTQLAHPHVSIIPTSLPPVVLTIVTIGLGVLFYQNLRPINDAQLMLAKATPPMQRLWDEMLHGVTAFAEFFSERWQSGSLRWYAGGVLAFAAGLTLYALNWTGLQFNQLDIDVSSAPWYAVALISLLCVAGVIVATARTRLQAAIAITATGFLTSLVFVIYRSPDILLTQILIETVSTIFVLLILFFLPAFKRDGTGPLGTLANLAIAIAVGVTMFLYVLYTTSDTFRNTDNWARAFLDATSPIGGGHNAVNVVIVDFRAGDTMGEITVLTVVGLLVFGLLRARRKAAAGAEPPAT